MNEILKKQKLLKPSYIITKDHNGISWVSSVSFPVSVKVDQVVEIVVNTFNTGQLCVENTLVYVRKDDGGDVVTLSVDNMDHLIEVPLKVLLNRAKTSFVVDLKPDPKICVLERPLDYLAIGSQDAARNHEGMKAQNVRFLVNVAGKMAAQSSPPPWLQVLDIEVRDDLDQQLDLFLPQAFQWIDKAKQENAVCLVCCNAGVSRSASVLIAYIFQQRDASLPTYKDALDFVKRARPIAKPNDSFEKQLKELEQSLSDT